MRHIEIRQVDPEEFVEFDVNHYAFGASPSARNMEESRARIPYLANGIPVAVFVDGEPQATASFRDMTQNVRGTVIPMSGVGGVASLPAGRRQGYVRKLLAFGFERVRERGLPVSALYPFRESFYERLGYVSAAAPRYATIRPESLAPLLLANLQGEIQNVEMGEGFDRWRTFLEVYQRDAHGFSLSNLVHARAAKSNNQDWLTTITERDRVTGAMLYRITGHTGDMVVSRFYNLTINARYQLLSWVARHVDQVAIARIQLGPLDLPETWLADIQAQSSTKDLISWPPPMNRILSLDRINGIGTGPDPAAITIAVADDTCPWNRGTWRLTSEDGRLQVASSTAQPRANLSIQGLSALVYNGADPDMFAVRGWGDVDSSAANTLRQMFPPAFPVLNEEF